jgi:tripartite-type tricarboxylate transporter receptor subunit TctC
MNLPARSAVIAWLVGVTLAAAASGNAAEFPARPIRVVVPYAAGGPTDVLGRLVAEFLGRDLGQAAFVENRPGTQGAIGAETVARADADGYTLLIVAGSMIVQNPLLYSKLSYDPARDFRMLALITEVPLVMEVHPSVPARTVAEFVAYAKQNPGKLTYLRLGGNGRHHSPGRRNVQANGRHRDDPCAL